MDRIADSSGVAKGTLYLYFRTKEALFLALYVERLRAWYGELESLAAERVNDPVRIAQAVRRTVGKWVGESYRRQPMIVPTVIEL